MSQGLPVRRRSRCPHSRGLFMFGAFPAPCLILYQRVLAAYGSCSESRLPSSSVSSLCHSAGSFTCLTTPLFLAMSQSIANQHPFALPFFVRITHVRYREDPHTPSPVRGTDNYWRPSTSGRFHSLGYSDWWIWDPRPHQPPADLHRLRRPTAQELSRLRLYRKCTMIWDPERAGYIQVPVNCLETLPSPDAWRRLSFGWSEEEHREHIALVGHNRERPTLHYPGPAHWFPQLLPQVCKGTAKGQQQCMLAGDLSMLAGLVAFSTTPQHDFRALDRSFRRDVNSTVFRANTLPKSSSKCLL